MARLVPPARHTPLYRQPGGRSVNQRQVREHSRSRSLRKTFLEADAICVITAAFVGWYVEQQKNSRRYVHFCRLPQSPLKNFKKRIKKILFFLRFLKLNRRFHKSYLSCLAMSRWRGCVNKLGVLTVKKSTETARRSFRLEVLTCYSLTRSDYDEVSLSARNWQILWWKSENQVSFSRPFLKFCRRRIYLTNWLEIWSRWQRHHIGLSGLKCPWWKSGIRSHCDSMVIWKTVWRCIFYASLWVLNEYAGLCSRFWVVLGVCLELVYCVT